MLLAVLMLTACTGDAADPKAHLTSWIAGSKWPSAVLNIDERLARIVVAVTDVEDAKRFFKEFTKRAREVDEHIPDVRARITWPVEGGLTGLELSGLKNTSETIWELAAKPLPRGATERHIGWTSLQVPGVGRDSQSEMLNIEELIAEEPPTVVAYHYEPTAVPGLVRTPGEDPNTVKYLGPFTGSEGSGWASDLLGLKIMQIEATSFRGQELVLAHESDLTHAMRGIRRQRWTVHADRLTYQVNTSSQRNLPYLPDLLARTDVTAIEINGSASVTVEASDCAAAPPIALGDLTVHVQCRAP